MVVTLTRRPGVASPVAIGGVGGSGTRLVAQLLIDLGYFMGADLNEANDNLWFTLLFKRVEVLVASEAEIARDVAIFTSAMKGRGPLDALSIERAAALAGGARPNHDPDWLAARVRSLHAWGGRPVSDPRPWGWKEPNTHVILPLIAPLLPELSYIHVARNGLDIAYSSNQNQLMLWGIGFLGVDPVEPSPRLSLKYWRAVQHRVEVAGASLGDRFLMLDFDRFCAAPSEGLERLLDFLGLDPTAGVRSRLLSSIRFPPSIGRFRSHPPADLDPDDVAFARRRGFDTSYPGQSPGSIDGDSSPGVN